jgi:3-oxoacyl-[acyl-carrier-protein] synthase-3
MEGNKVYKLAVRAMSSAVEDIIKRNNLTSQDVDWIIPHQANLRIIEGVADKLKVPMSKVIVNIEKYANMSSATVPVAADEAIRSKKIRRGDIMVMVAFGAGMTWGSVLARY